MTGETALRLGMNYRFLVSLLLIVLLSTTSAAQTTRGVKAAKVKDPVCGLMVDKDPELSVKYAGVTYYFCTRADMAQFRKHPAKYAKKHIIGQVLRND